MQLRDQVEDLRLHVVHVGVPPEPPPIVGDRVLLELLERALDLCAHVGLTLIPAHPHPVAPEVDRVPDGGEIVLDALGIPGECGERVGCDVAGQVIAQPEEAPGAQLPRLELLTQRANGAAVQRSRLEEPALLLAGVVELSHQLQMPAHLLHSAGELAHGLEHGLLLEVPQHMMAVLDNPDVVQGPIEEAREVVLLAPGGERGHDLVEPQVGKEVGLAGRPVGATFAAIEQNALERARRDCDAAIR